MNMREKYPKSIITQVLLSYKLFQLDSMPHPHHETQHIMKQCKSLRTHGCNAFVQLEIWLQFMYQTILDRDNIFITCGCGFKQTNEFKKKFFSAFQKLSQLQAAKYYHHMLNVIHDYVGCEKTVKSSSLIKGNVNISLVSSKIVQKNLKPFSVDIIKKGFFNNTERIHYLEVSLIKSTLLIKSQNNPYDLQINLENYLCRESKGNHKHHSKKQFVIHKTTDDHTPDELRFAMKDVQEYPQFFNFLWNTILDIHAKKIRDLIDKLSDKGSKKGFVQIVLRQSHKFLINPESQRGLTTYSTSQPSQPSQSYTQYLDIKHPINRLESAQFQHFCTSAENDAEGHFLWQRQWQTTQKGYLKNINFEYIAVQRNAVKKVIKSFISMGNGETELPIQMFSHQSNLLQLARACKYFCYFFQSKKQQNHKRQKIIIDGIKKCVGSIVGFLIIRNRMEKPIKPFIGETYQGYIDNYPIYLQQISQNQSYLLFQTQQFKLYGCLRLQTSISGVNSILAGSKGFLTIQLKNVKPSPKIKFTLPMIELSGLIYGDRLVQINDTSIIYQEQSGIIIILNWGKNKKAGRNYHPQCERQDFLKGQIIKLKNQKKIDLSKFIQNPKEFLKHFLKENNLQERKLGEIYGNWTDKLYYLGKDQQKQVFFKIEEQKPEDLFNYKFPLPSDCRLRKDIKLLEAEKLTQAEQEMKIGENQEKIAQILRNEFKKK